jgi:hypothetical protein
MRIIPVFFISLFFLVNAVVCSAQRWVKRNQDGFVVDHPPGWQVQVERDWVVIHSADKQTFALIYPFMLKGRVPAARWLAALPAPIAGLFPQARILRSQQRKQTPDEVMASLTYGPGQAGRAALLCSISGHGGMLFAIAAPVAQYKAQKAALVAVLQSFKFTARRPAPASNVTVPNVAYARFADPREHAFTIEVPKGWLVEGGLFRGQGLETRSVINVTSPDQQVYILNGDAKLPSYTIPNAALQSVGLTEGKLYRGTIIARPRSGSQYLQRYLPERRAPFCANPRIVELRDNPAASQRLNNLYARGASGVQFHFGEAAFTCAMGGKEMRGYFHAATLVMWNGSVGNWSVPDLGGFIAVPERVALGQTVLSHMQGSYSSDPQWVRNHLGTAAALAEQNRQTNEAVQNMMMDSYWARQKTLDNTQRQTINTILNRTDLVDPETGEKYQAVSGSNYYWYQPHTDTIIGTQTANPPRPDIPVNILKVW